MEIPAVVAVSHGLDFLLGRLLEFYVTINSWLCHINYSYVSDVYSIHSQSIPSRCKRKKKQLDSCFNDFDDVRMYASHA